MGYYPSALRACGPPMPLPLHLLNLQLVKRRGARRPEQADAEDGFAGFFGNAERFLFFVPVTRPTEGADHQWIELLALVVVERDGDVRYLVLVLATDDVV